MPHPAYSFEALSELRRDHTTLRLLCAGNAPLILSFLHRAFVAPNSRSLSETDALALLDELRRREPRAQAVEVRLSCNVLNRMLELGAPKSYSIGK